MININNKKSCTGCSACASICPNQCIEMEPDSEGFLYPFVDKSKCVNCSLCEKVCPVQNNSFEPINNYPDAYLCYDFVREDRIHSAAGGGFFALAESFIRKLKGVVFGAVYDEHFKILHCGTESIEGIKRMQKSKYAQSDPLRSFSEVKRFLDNNRYVLYSGTPCQIYGLKSYLKKGNCNCERLFCIDLSCHGVPSPKLLKEYLDYQERLHKSKIKTFKMRDKRLIKNAYEQGFSIIFENDDHYFANHVKDYFGRCFWGEIASRPSCYECSFKTIWRISDITLGDCWFFDRFVKKEKDDLGVTMFLVQSEKGKQLMHLCDNLIAYEVDAEKLIKVNGGMIFESAKSHSNREEFFSKLGREDFEIVVKRYFPDRSISFRNEIQKFFEERGVRFELLRKKHRQRRMESIIKEKEIPECSKGIRKI